MIMTPALNLAKTKIDFKEPRAMTCSQIERGSVLIQRFAAAELFIH